MKKIIINKHSREVKHLKSNDKTLSNLIDLIGDIALNIYEEKFPTIIRIIIGQQLSEKAAKSIYGRLTNSIGKITPSEIAKCETSILRECGISNAKATYIINISKQILNKEIHFKSYDEDDDVEIINNLTSIKGIGIWSAEMFLIFGMGRMDVFSKGDVGLRRCIKQLYKYRKDPTDDDLNRISKKWKPYRTIASLYLWEAIDSGIINNM